MRGIVGIAALLLLGAGFFFLSKGALPQMPGWAGSFSANAAAPFTVPPLTQEYRNEAFRFSLKMPEGFRASELAPDENGAKTILLQDADGNGIQIYITPGAGGDAHALAAADVRAAIPDMGVSDEQSVEIGDDYTGVAFQSDNEAFGGASREVWFFFRGNLYQISTYARLDTLLQAMFGTWQFF